MPRIPYVLNGAQYTELLVGTTELESVTSCMSSKRSNQLSYAPILAISFNIIPKRK